MKKGLLILASLLLVTTVFAFEAGHILGGGTIGFRSVKMSSDSDAHSIFSFAPEVAYFVMDNLAVDAILNYGHSGTKNNYSNAFALGAGARYIFLQQAYAGTGLEMEFNSDKYAGFSSSYNAMYLFAQLGYLAPISERAFIDIRAKYKMGIGDYGGDYSSSNEESDLGVRAGLQVLF